MSLTSLSATIPTSGQSILMKRGKRPFPSAPAGPINMGSSVMAGVIGHIPTIAATAEPIILASLAQNIRPPLLTKNPLLRTSQHLPNPKTPSQINPPTPVNIQHFNNLLQGYDPIKKAYIISGLTQGFPLDRDLHDQFPQSHIQFFNHQSALCHSDIVTTKLLNEVKAPFSEPAYPNSHISPLALVKKKTKGTYHLIHNLSFPEGLSVNDQISKTKGTVKYQHIDDGIESILELEPGCVLPKSDLEHAFKILPVHPNDVPKKGMYWNSSFLYDLTLAMGCLTNCHIFVAFSSAVEWILVQKFHIKHVHYILDDFFIVWKPQSIVQKQLHIFLDVCKYLDIPVILSKTESGMVIIFLCIKLDTINMEARLPKDKLDKCATLISNILDKTSVCQVELMSLVGLLNFACHVLRPGRAFLSRLHDAIATVNNKFHHIKVSGPMKLDLTTSFISEYNSKTLFPTKDWANSNTLHSYTDASKKGYRLILGSHWVYVASAPPSQMGGT